MLAEKILEKILSFPENLISFILNPEFEGIFLYIKTIFIIVSFLFVGGIIFLLIINSWLKRLLWEDLVETFAARPYGAKKIFKQWAKIQKRLETGKEDEYKLALIEADSLLDDILTRMGYAGDSMGDRLKQINSTILPNIEQVWEVHKVRNNIVHDPDYRVTSELVKRAMEIYKKALQDLEAF